MRKCNCCDKEAKYFESALGNPDEATLCPRHFASYLLHMIHWCHTGIEDKPSEETCRNILTSLGCDWKLSCFYFHDSWGYEAIASLKSNKYKHQSDTAQDAMYDVLRQVLKDMKKVD